MRVLLTGITGNLGHEIALDLLKRGFSVIPILRQNRGKEFNLHNLAIEQVAYNDLLSTEELDLNDAIDCVVHAAGNVHFLNAGDSNQKMTSKLVKVAKKLNIPLYLVSTAYVYRPKDHQEKFNNAYELDKFQAEQILISSGIKFGIFRPSVLVGNSKTGEIQNYSGYYNIVKAFYNALTKSKQEDRKLRFPNLLGKSNLVPVDQAAYYIGNEVKNLNLGSWYITNPDPPTASWVLSETLNYFNLKEVLELINLSFEKFANLNLTPEEEILYQFTKHFYPYWSIEYSFPPTICKDNLISSKFLNRILSYMSSSEFLKNG